MKRSLITGGLAALAVTASLAGPASAHGNDHRDDRDDRRYYSRRDARHDREHAKLADKHDRAHDRGFYSRRDHERWHRKASNKHDVIHHRVYGEHAPERRAGSRYYNPDRYRSSRYSRRSDRRHCD